MYKEQSLILGINTLPALQHREHMASLMNTRKPDGSGLEVRINASLLSTAKPICLNLSSHPTIQFILLNIFIIFKNSIINKKKRYLTINDINSAFDSKNRKKQ